MKNFIESLKDILYDSMDYIIMLAIIIGVVSVIGWRLDILFTKDTAKTLDNNVIAEEVIPSNEEPDKNTGDSEEEEDLANKNEDTSQLEDEEEITKNNVETITIDIPDGSLPSKIGSILEANGLVKSKNDFVQKAQSMDLDRSLRSGSYTFNKDSTLEDIVSTIARQR